MFARRRGPGLASMLACSASGFGGAASPDCRGGLAGWPEGVAGHRRSGRRWQLLTPGRPPPGGCRPGRLSPGHAARPPVPATAALTAFRLAGKRHRRCSSCPRGRNGRRHRRSARLRPPRHRLRVFWLIEAIFDGAASLASARSKVSPAVNDSVSFCSFSAEETPTPSGISNTKRTKVGCTDARTRIGGRFFGLGDRPLLTQRALGVPRALGQFTDHLERKAGGGPSQVSGNRSMNTRSPAVMVLMVTLRASDSRIAEPSGSRRAEAT